MRSGPVRTRSFLMVLIGWLTLSLAPVVALGASTAGFAVLAAGLVAVTTLRFSMRWGLGVAVVSIVVYALASAVGPVAPWTIGADDVERLGRSLLRARTLVPDLLAALSFTGTAALAELASLGLDFDAVFRGAVREARREPAPAEPAGARRPVAESALMGTGGAGEARGDPATTLKQGTYDDPEDVSGHPATVDGPGTVHARGGRDGRRGGPGARAPDLPLPRRPHEGRLLH